MDNTAKWIIGVMVAAVIVFGAWWLMTRQSPSASVPGENATTTALGSETGAPGSITPQHSTGNVANVIADLKYGDRFAQLLVQTGVAAQLGGKGPYTIFVPSDGAFGRLVPGTISSLSAAALKRLVEYHVVSGKKLDVDAVQSGQIQALSKDMLNFQVDANDKVYVNSGYVLAAYNASNGIVYVINSVLLPPKPMQ